MCWFNYLNFQLRYVVLLLNDFIWKNKRASSKDMFLLEWIISKYLMANGYSHGGPASKSWSWK